MFIRSLGGLITVVTVLAAFIAISFSFRSVWADSTLAKTQKIEISNPSQAFLSQGKKAAYFIVNPFQRTSVNASLDDHEDCTQPIYPWSRNHLELERFAKPIFVVMVPPTDLMSLLKFKGWSVKITVSDSANVIATESIDKYLGEPILLGRNIALSGTKSLTPVGAISPESLDRLTSIQDGRGNGNPSHMAKVSLNDKQYFFTTTAKQLLPKVHLRIGVQFNFENEGNPPQSINAIPFLITPEFDGDLNVIVKQLETDK